MKVIENQTFDMERALYGCDGVLVKDCSFDGPADGESAFKEGKNIEVQHCFFNLRYPFWHDHGLVIENSDMTELCRAALWYSDHVEIRDTRMHGIKALRECSDITVRHCDVISPEFGWFVQGIRMEDTTVAGEYFMMRSENLSFKGVELKGKYSFQYIKNAVFENCVFDTKDAFWHGENVTVWNSVINGEYLAWYSDGLTLINCKIVGTQPLCYCRNLKLIDCEMVDTIWPLRNLRWRQPSPLRWTASRTRSPAGSRCRNWESWSWMRRRRNARYGLPGRGQNRAKRA